MDQALDSQEQSAFIEREVFARFRRFGGVRTHSRARARARTHTGGGAGPIQRTLFDKQTKG